MPRAQFSETVIAPLGPGGVEIPLSGVAATVYNVNPDGSEGSGATAYAGRTGSTGATLVTDSSGTVNFWLDVGEYNVHMDDQTMPHRITSYVRGFSPQPRHASSHSPAGVDPLSGITGAQLSPTAGIVAGQVASAFAASAGVNQGGVGAKGFFTTGSVESRTNTAYGTLATPDQVTGLVLPPDGRIVVAYQATWQESVAGAARAAIFLNDGVHGNQQLKIASMTGAGAVTQAAATNSGSANLNRALASCGVGLVSGDFGAAAYSGDVTTGQAIGLAPFGSETVNPSHELNGSVFTYRDTYGVCEMFAAPGTYAISIQFKALSGSVTVFNRRLWVAVETFV